MKKHIELFIFDLDGTLADTSQDIANAVNRALTGIGKKNLSTEEIIRCVGDGLETLLVRCAKTRRPSAINEAEKIFKEYYARHLLDNTVLYPGVTVMLESFKGKKFAVASNKPVKFVNAILEKSGIARHFAIALGGDSARRKKPAPDQLNFILDRLSADRSKTIFVGDSTNDIEAAVQAGVLSCYLLSGFNKGLDIKSAKPDYIINNIPELSAHFD